MLAYLLVQKGYNCNVAPFFMMPFLAELGDLRPGSLSTQYNVCGSPGRRCKASPPEKHGPYYQVSYTRKGKSSSKFVKNKDLPVIRKQLKNYARMKLLMDR